MKFLFKVIVYVVLAFVAKSNAALTCEEQCTANPGSQCVCASTTSPISLEQTPQFITITFDDAVTPALESYVNQIFNNRKNPDNNPITGTFYVPHPYSDYQIVNRLCNKGHEIGLNSISKGGVDYWRNIDANQVNLEFSGGRTILNTFGNVPFTEPYGARIPNLQLAGDATFGGYTQAGVHHDSSCVVSYSNRLFPFNLNYPTSQTCFIGSLPTQAHPGRWVLPIVALRRPDGFPCNALAGCLVNGTAVQISNWLKQQFLEAAFSNRAPMTLMVSKMWFELYPSSLEALKLFLDYLATFPAVYVVSHREVLRWAANPTPLPYTTNVVVNACGACNNPHTCVYTVNLESRVMRVCGECPAVYPGLGNPTGVPPS